jgi:hypothetical protein
VSLAHVAAVIEADNRARVMAATFGHLAPTVGTTYVGTILFAHSRYGDGTVPIVTDFGDLPDSPWFYHGMCEYLIEHRATHGEAADGRVYRWYGTYEFRNWPDEYTPDGFDIAREGGHEHVFTGEFFEVLTGG